LSQGEDSSKIWCKRPSMLEGIAFYSTITKPKLAPCQPRAQTISPVRWEQSPVARLQNY